MPQQLSSPNPRGAMITPFVIWYGFLMACVVYAVMVGFLLHTPTPTGPPPPPLPLPGIAIVSILSVAALAGSVFVLGVMKKRDSPDDSPIQSLAKFQLRMIINAACYESVAIFALVGFFAFGLTKIQALAFIALAFLLVLSILPGVIANVGRYKKAMEQGNEA